MNWIGQNIYDLVARFRDDVYLEDISTGTIASGGSLGLDSNNKIVKATASGGISHDGSTANGVLTYKDADEATVESNLTFDGSTLTLTGLLTVTGDAVTFQSANADDPIVTIKNTSDGINDMASLNFIKDRSSTAATNDNLAEIYFTGQDASGNKQEYGRILCEIDVATHGQESGRLKLGVANHDGGNGYGLTMQGGSVNDEVDVTVGLGAASVTTVSGTLTMGSTATLNNTGILQTAAQTNITSLGTLTALDVDDINLNTKTITITGDTSDTFTITTGAAGATTLETIDNAAAAGHFEVAADGNITLDAAGNIYLESAGNTMDLDADYFSFSSSTSGSPHLNLRSTIASAVGAKLQFTKDRYTSAGADGDDIGTILFNAGDAAQTQTDFANIIGEISEADDTDAAGKLPLNVAASDGTTTALNPGLILEGEHATGSEVDVTIANGAASLTTVAGDLTVTSKATIPTRKFTVPSDAHFETQGDVVYFGGGSTTQGELCYLKADGEWAATDANAVATSGGVLLALALGTDPDVDGMLLRGMFTLDHDPGTIADELYISTTAGDITATAPSATGDIVRVIGYCLNSTDGMIWFNPSNDFIVLA